MKLELFNKLKDIKGLWFIIIGILSGLTLLILANIGDSPPSQSEQRELSSDSDIIKNYASELEGKISELIIKINGAGNASVMLTLDSGSERIYAQKASDSMRDYIVIKGASNSEEPILVKEITPKIRGVAVVCPGAADTAVRIKIIDLIATVFNVPTNRIYVTS